MMRRLSERAQLGSHCERCTIIARRFQGIFDHDNYNYRRPDELVRFAARSPLLREVGKKKTVLHRKAYGIPFRITDERALDAAMQHHRTAVMPHSVERYLVPFWAGIVHAGGTMRAEVLQVAGGYTSRTTTEWCVSPPLDFSYPFGEHTPANQVAASYAVNIPYVEETLRGDHVPSMLLSREELLEELQEMKTAPKLLEFDRSTDTALGILKKRINKDFVDIRARQELRKFHGNYKAAVIVYNGLSLQIESLRPVFLPLYKIQVSTKFHTKQLPVYVCGATGKCAGPVIAIPRQKLFSMSIGTSVTTLAGGLALLEPISATAAALSAGAGAYWSASKLSHSRASATLHQAEQRHTAEVAIGVKLDETGWKWTVADEEKHEYMYREELREKARKRAAFEERVREETAREHAELGFDPRLRTRARGRKFANPDRDLDPCKYYATLGLAGRELTATAKDIQQAFRVEAQKNHPDLHTDNEAAANEAMQRILEAYNVLRDTKLRKEYDGGKLLMRDKA